MRLRFSILGALVAALTMSLVGAGSASAHEFEATVAGLILSEVAPTNGVQKFKTAAGLLECTKAHGIGTASLKSLTQEILVTYTGCNANGSKIVVHNLSTGITGKSEPVEYEFSADGSVKVLKEIVIEGSGTGPGEGRSVCFVTVPPQTLTSIAYKNITGGIIEEITEVSGIESTGIAGSALSCKYAKEKAGTYTGNSLVKSLAGGSLKWN